MTKLLAIAAVLLASTAAAQAQYSFEYGGRTIRIDPDRGTVSIPGVYDNSGRHHKRAKVDDADQKHKTAPSQQAKTDPQAAPSAAPPAAAASPAPTEQAAVPAAPPPAAPAAPPAPAATETVAVAPSDTAATLPPPPAPPPLPQQEAAPAAPALPPPAAPTVATIAPPPPAPAPRQAANAAPAANSPLGIWLTEEKEGKVRIEQCGANLCGYSVDKKSNENGEQVLINMKPLKDKWSGRILDPNTGSTYDSTIAMKGTDTLRVQGCAFGGMFCGGQTWTRSN
jgi:hypothetical protein